jgi:hypothetical protein
MNPWTGSHDPGSSHLLCNALWIHDQIIT